MSTDPLDDSLDRLRRAVERFGRDPIDVPDRVPLRGDAPLAAGADEGRPVKPSWTGALRRWLGR